MRPHALLVAIACLGMATGTGHGQILLNEIVTSNVESTFDEDEEAPDWIELYNSGTEAVNLEGYGLSDDPDEPDKWLFPDVTLEAGAYRLVFASAEDRPDPGELHTNFRLSSDGETVVLTDATGALLDSVDTGELFVDDSRGRPPGGGDPLVFLEPTPLAANTTEGRPGYAPMPTVSVPGGVYAEAQTLSMSTTSPDALIHYSLDSSDPDETHPLFIDPITPAGAVSVVRARAFEDGLWPSRIATHTYLLDPTHELPIVSVVMDPEDLDFIYEAPRDNRERAGHIEHFDGTGPESFGVGTGVKIHGFLGSLHDQLSLRMMVRGGYGEGEIDYPLFGPTGVDTFERIILRNGGNDWCDSNLRDALVQSLAEGEDLDTQDYQPVAAYVNGEYFGFYNMRERYDRFYFESHFGVDPDAIDFLGVLIFAGGLDVIEGDTEHYDALIEFVTTNDLNDPANYAYVQTQMDTVEYANYVIFQVFSGNTDWPGNNNKWWRPRTPDGRWRWVIFDTEAGLGAGGGPSRDTLAGAFNTLFEAMVSGAPFRHEFINRYADLLNTRLRPEVTVGRLRDMAFGIFPEVPDHFERWECGGLGSWASELLEIKDYLERRPEFAVEHIVENFELVGTLELSLDVSPAGGGAVELTAITVDAPFSGTYFQGVPVSLTAVPTPGWAFAGWSDPALPQVPTVEVDPGGDYAVTALFEPSGSAVIHEINYNSSPIFDPEDWIELHNPGAADVDLSGWILRDDDDLHAFTLPAGTLLSAGGYLVIARDVAAFQASFPGVPALGDLTFGFGSGGDEVRLFDAGGLLVDRVPYDDGAPWPEEPDGGGPTLELVAPELDNALPESWQASSAPHGTPGAANGTLP